VTFEDGKVASRTGVDLYNEKNNEQPVKTRRRVAKPVAKKPKKPANIPDVDAFIKQFYNLENEISQLIRKGDIHRAQISGFSNQLKELAKKFEKAKNGALDDYLKFGPGEDSGKRRIQVLRFMNIKNQGRIAQLVADLDGALDVLDSMPQYGYLDDLDGDY
jgi:hypothetical protein